MTSRSLKQFEIFSRYFQDILKEFLLTASYTPRFGPPIADTQGGAIVAASLCMPPNDNHASAAQASSGTSSRSCERGGKSSCRRRRNLLDEAHIPHKLKCNIEQFPRCNITINITVINHIKRRLV